MVRTTTGPAEKSTTKRDEAPEKPTAADRRMEKALDLDDETWDRIVQMGRSQSIDPAEVVRRSIVQSYGTAPVAAGYHTGLDNS